MLFVFPGHLRLTLLALYINVLMIIKKIPNDLFKLASCVVLTPSQSECWFIFKRMNCSINRRPTCYIKNISILVFQILFQNKVKTSANSLNSVSSQHSERLVALKRSTGAPSARQEE